MRKLNKEFWPYQLQVSREYIGDINNLKKIENWCNEFIGKRFVHWYSYMNDQGTLYAFTDEETLLTFKIRWYHRK